MQEETLLWYGWIPILTRSISISPLQLGESSTSLSDHSPSLTNFAHFTDEINGKKKLNNFLMAFGKRLHKSAKFNYNVDEKSKSTYEYQAKLTDNWAELKLGISHTITFGLENDNGHIYICPYCQQKNILLEITISSQEKKQIISAKCFIHSSGLVRYEITNKGKGLFYLVNQIHKAARDIFHYHVHHESDLLLPTTEAKNDNDALINLQQAYIAKFISNKKIIKEFICENEIAINYPEANRIILLTRGELIYAENLISFIKEEEREDNFFAAVKCTLSNFEKIIEAKKTFYTTTIRILLASFSLIISSFFLTLTKNIESTEIYTFSTLALLCLISTFSLTIGSRHINTYRLYMKILVNPASNAKDLLKYFISFLNRENINK